jgi:dephospho-CoA kinase
MNLGLTGGIATGKSTVSAMLVRRGAKLIDADQIAREVVLPGSPVLAQVSERFGKAVLQEDGGLHRKKLGEIIFADPSARKELENILHPPIRMIMKERMRTWETEHPHDLVVVDIPLLFESNLQSMFSEVMLVYTTTEIQLERLMRREGIGMFEAQLRLKAQMEIDKKKTLADIVIDNSGTVEETEKQIDDFWHRKGLR